MCQRLTKQILVITCLIVSLQFISIGHANELPRGIIQLDGGIAENFTIEDSDGNTYELDQSKGRWVFLHFWASWCGPCRKEMPIIHQLETQFKDQPIDIVLINVAEDEDTIFSFLGTVASDLQSYMDKDGELAEIYAPRGLPTTFFIDPAGKKRYLALGGRHWTKPQYQAFLKSLFDTLPE